MDSETLQREAEAMAFGRGRWPEARGLLLYHEYSPGVDAAIAGAEPAWKFLSLEL